MTQPEQYLICPNHGEEHPRTVETEDGEMVRCLRCSYLFQNVLKYPVVQLHKRFTGKIVYQNTLTGEYMDAETAKDLNSQSPEFPITKVTWN